MSTLDVRHKVMLTLDVRHKVMLTLDARHKVMLTSHSRESLLNISPPCSMLDDVSVSDWVNQFPKSLSIRFGVPQGLVLDPVLFNIYQIVVQSFHRSWSLYYCQ